MSKLALPKSVIVTAVSALVLMPISAHAVCEFDASVTDFDFDVMGTETGGSGPKTFDAARPQAYADQVDLALNCDEQIGYQLTAAQGYIKNTNPPPFTAANFTDEIPFTVIISRDQNPARRHNSEDLPVGESGPFGGPSATTVRIRVDVDPPENGKRLIAGPYAETLTITLVP